MIESFEILALKFLSSLFSFERLARICGMFFKISHLFPVDVGSVCTIHNFLPFSNTVWYTYFT